MGESFDDFLADFDSTVGYTEQPDSMESEPTDDSFSSIFDNPDKGNYVKDSSRGFLGNMAAKAGRGILNVVNMNAEFLEALGFENSVDEWSAEAPRKYNFLKPTKSEYYGKDGLIKSALGEVPESLTTSLAAAGEGAAIGAAIGSGFFGIGAAPAAVLGSIAGIVGLFGIGNGHKKLEDNLAKGMNYEDAMDNAILTGAIESGGELASDAISLMTFGVGGKAATKFGSSLVKGISKQGAKATAKNLLKSSTSNSMKTLAKSVVAENVTELGQLYGESKVDQMFDVPGAEVSAEDYFKTAITTTGMSLILGGLGVGTVAAKRNMVKRYLESGDKEKMAVAKDIVADELKKTGDDELVDYWNTTVDSYIASGKPVNLDANVIEMGRKLDDYQVTTPDDLTSDNPAVQEKAVENAFYGAGIHPDGTPMTEEEKAEFAKKAEETVHGKANQYNAEKLAAMPERDQYGPGVTDINNLDSTESLATERVDITDEVKKTEEIFAKIENDEKLDEAEKKQLRENIALFQANRQENKAQKNILSDTNSAVAQAKAAKENTSDEKVEQEVGRGIERVVRDRKTTGKSADSVGEISQSVQENQEAIQKAVESNPVVKGTETPIKETNGKEGGKQAPVSEKKKAPVITPAVDIYNTMEKAQAPVDTTSLSEPLAPVAESSLENYTKGTRDRVTVETPEDIVAEMEVSDLEEEKTDEAPEDILDVKTDDPVINAVIKGDTKFFKGKEFRSGEGKGGQVSARKVRDAIDRAANERFESKSLYSQFKYMAEDFVTNNILAREDRSGDVKWDESIPGMSVGKDSTGKEYMISQASTGQKYSIYTRDKGGKWVEGEKRFSSIENAKESLTPDTPGKELIDTKPVKIDSDKTDYVAVALKGIGKAKGYSIEKHSANKKNSVFWIIRNNKTGNRASKQLRTKREALSMLNDLVNGDAAEFSERAYDLAMRTKVERGHGQELAQAVYESYQYGSTLSKLAEALYNAYGDKLRDIRVYHTKGKSIFYSNGSIYVGEEYVDRYDLQLHEIVHALTSDVINQNIDGVRDKVAELVKVARENFLTREQSKIIEGITTSAEWFSLDEEVRKNLFEETKGIAYALINEKEFLANAFNNKHFREAMNKTPAKNVSVWSKLVNLIRIALKIPVTKGSMLEEVFDLTSTIADIKADKVTTKSLEADAAVSFEKHLESSKVLWKSALKKADKYLISLNDRIARIDPKVAAKLRRMEFNINQKNLKYTNGVRGFLEMYKGLTSEQKEELDYLWNNADEKKDEFLKAIREYGMEKEFSSVQKVLKDLNNEYQESGLSVYGNKELYVPRRVNDIDGLYTYMYDELGNGNKSVITSLMEDKNLSVADKEQAVSHLLNTGYHQKKIAMRRPGAAKKRSIAHVNHHMSREYYYNLNDALIHHIAESVEAIEIHNVIKPKGLKAIQNRMNIYARKIAKAEKAGKKPDAKMVKWLEGAEEEMQLLIERDHGSISAYLVNNRPNLRRAEAKELTDMLRARFNQRGITSKWMQSVKNIGLLTALGSYNSAVTQIGDISWSIHQHGLNNTLKAMISKKEITKDDLNFDSTIRELHDGGESKWLEWTLKYSGFSGMDRFMKQTNMTAALMKAREMSKEEFVNKWTDYFENPAKVYQEIKSGKMTEGVKYLAWCEVSKMQPVSLSEMPEGYLLAGNGRIFYTLKSYSLKTMSNVVRVAFDSTESTPSRVKAALRLTLIVAMANAGADTIKDMLMGREVDLSDEVFENILKMFMVNRYQLDKATNMGTGTVFVDMLTPPVFRSVNDVSKDFFSWISLDPEKKAKFNTLKMLPFIGKITYEYTDAGLEKKLRKVSEKINEFKKEGKRPPTVFLRRQRRLKIELGKEL